MSLDKAIQHGREHRRPYRGAKEAATVCRNHNWCPYCRGNRLHSTMQRLTYMTSRLEEYKRTGITQNEQDK